LKPEPFGGRRPLVSFERSAEGEGRKRASLEETSAPRRVSMPPLTRSRATSSKRKKTASKKIRLVKGRIRLRVSGYDGVQSISPAQLVRFIPVSQIRVAAKKVLRLDRRASANPRRRRKKGKGGKKSGKKAAKKGKRSGLKSARRKSRKTSRGKKKKRTAL